MKKIWIITLFLSIGYLGTTIIAYSQPYPVSPPNSYQEFWTWGVSDFPLGAMLMFGLISVLLYMRNGVLDERRREAS